jgi:hypothetical protein
MFTSCGWFFSDISGIEPRQNIHYAVRTIDLYQQFTNTDLFSQILPILQQARSNKRHEGSGRTIAKSFLHEVGGEAEAAAYFLINRKVARFEDLKNQYGKFLLVDYIISDEQNNTVTIKDVTTLKTTCIDMKVTTVAGSGYLVDMSIDNADNQDSQIHTYSTAHIPPRMLDEVFTWIDHSLSRITDEELHQIATDIRHYSLLVKNGRSTPSETLYVENMGTCLRALRSLFTTPNTLSWEHKRESISHLLEFIMQKGRQYEQDIVNSIFTHEISRIAIRIYTQGFNYERGSYLLEVIRVAREQGIQPLLTQAQEALHPYIKGELSETFSTPLAKHVLEELTIALNFSLE